MFLRRTEKETPPSWRYAIPLVVALVVFVAYSVIQRGPWLLARNDFPAFYIAGHLQPEGKIYDIEAQHEQQARILEGRAELLLFNRPAFYALYFVPLAKLPYLTAYGIYLLLQLFVLCIWFRMTWSTAPKLVLTAGMSLPLLLALGNGQDVVMVTSLCGIAWHLLDRRPLAAGFVLALCSIKFHLFLLVPFALARHGRWKTLGAGALGGLGLVALSFAAGGRDWITQYRKILETKGLEGDLNQAGNIRALADAAGMPPELAPWLMGAGFLSCLYLMWRSRTLEHALVCALCGTLIFNWHSFLQDFTLLLTFVPWIPRLGLGAWADRLWRLILSPVPYVAAMPGAPFSALLPLSMLAFLKLSQEREGK